MLCRRGWSCVEGLVDWCVGLTLAATPMLPSTWPLMVWQRWQPKTGTEGAMAVVVPVAWKWQWRKRRWCRKRRCGQLGQGFAPGQNKQEGSSAIGKGQDADGAAKTASAFGKVNGFCASPNALAHASVRLASGAIPGLCRALGNYRSLDQAKAMDEIDAANEKLESRLRRSWPALPTSRSMMRWSLQSTAASVIWPSKTSFRRRCDDQRGAFKSPAMIRLRSRGTRRWQRKSPRWPRPQQLPNRGLTLLARRAGAPAPLSREWCRAPTLGTIGRWSGRLDELYGSSA